MDLLLVSEPAGVLFVCLASIWLDKPLDVLNPLSHTWQTNGLILWTEASCCFKAIMSANFLQHIEQANVFTTADLAALFLFELFSE